jgi:predicted acyl esterase
MIARAVFFCTLIVFSFAAAAQEGAPVSGRIEVFMPMRDGTKLAANVFLPSGAGAWPVIVTRTPYLKEGAMFAGDGSKHFTDAGYAYVVQDVRGKGHSEGHYEAYADDILDGYDTVEWLAVQKWSNGKIGITGASAMGIASNAAAVAHPPHLVAAFITVAPTDRFNTVFINGVFKDKDTVDWMKNQSMGPEYVNRLKARVEHDVFWDRNDMSVGRKYISIPIYNVGGWYDIFSAGSQGNFNYLQNHGADGARGNQKLRMGPFGHGALSGNLAYPGEDQLGAARSADDVRWFDYWLKGIDNGIMDEPPVSYFMMAAAEKGAASPKNRWIKAANWPPASRETRYYLGADKSLSAKAPSGENQKLSYKADPANPVPTVGGANLMFERGPMDQRAIPQRQDYLRFVTPVLKKDVAIAGEVALELFAATDGPDTDFVAKLVDVYPDGYEALVLDAPIRAKYRNGRMPDEAKLMTPGAPEKMVIGMWGTAITFEAGHRIAVHVSSSSSPRFEVNSNTADGKTKRVATNSIYVDRSHPSAIVLPVIYPGD